MPHLLVFGIDAATLDLIRPWLARGDLPALGRLIREGASGPLGSVPNMITPAAWTTFATGCNPGRHGIFFFTERVPGSYEERFIKGGTRAVTPFWMLTGEHGVRTTVVNVPMTFPADPVHGVMVSGIDAPGLDARGFTHPPELVEELRTRFGALLAGGSLSSRIGHLVLRGRIDDAKEVLIRQVRMRTQLTLELMARHPTEVCVVVHTEVDGAQHYFWRYVDPRIPGTPVREVRRYGDVILRLYQEVDRSLEALVREFGPDAVIVVSDHGAGASPGTEDGVPWIRLVLEQMGLAVRRIPPDTLRRSASGAITTLYRTINPRLPRAVRGAIRRWVPGARQAVRTAIQYRYDWRRTRAFCMGAAGDVWLNVRGRDPEGVIEPGTEYEDVRARIKDTFLGLCDAGTGQPVVEAVLFRENVYSGPFVERAPDLFIRFRDVVINEISLDNRVLRLPRQSAAAPKDVKSGSHRPNGLIVLTGQGIPPGIQIRASLMDVAPTLLFWLGIPIPAHMEGRVLVEAFTEDFRFAHPVQTNEVGTPEVRLRSDGYSPEEAQVVAARLRDLGYV